MIPFILLGVGAYMIADSLKKEYAHGGVLKGGYENLQDELLSQKIQIFLDEVKPYKYYYVDEDSNTLYIGFDKDFTQDAAEKVYKGATSSMEFFDADEVEMEYNPNTKDTIYKIKLKHSVNYAKGGEIITPNKPIEKMNKLELMEFVKKIDPLKYFYPATTPVGRTQAKGIYEKYLERKKGDGSANENMADGGYMAKGGNISDNSKQKTLDELDRRKNEILKKADVLIAKKKKLYSNVDIESPMSVDEKKLHKDINDLLSEANQIVMDRRKIIKGGYMANGGKNDILYSITLKPMVVEKSASFEFNINKRGDGNNISGDVLVRKRNSMWGETDSYEFANVEGFDWVYFIDNDDEDYISDKRSEEQKNIEKEIKKLIEKEISKNISEYKFAYGGYMEKGGEMKSRYIVTFAFTDDDGEYGVQKSKPIPAKNEDDAAIILKDQFESFEGISCDIISVEKLADGGYMAKGGSVKEIEVKMEDGLEIEITKEDEGRNAYYSVNYENNGMEITGNLIPYKTGRTTEYEFSPSWFDDKATEDYYADHWEEVEEQILKVFYENAYKRGGKI
jgi:hypothetical protein